MAIEIKFIDRGIGYSYNSTIELNRNLIKMPDLMQDIIEHEKEHIKARNVFQDIWIGVKDWFNFKKQRKMAEFIKNYAPEAGRQSATPIWFENGQVMINKPLLIVYATASLIGVAILIVVI